LFSSERILLRHKFILISKKIKIYFQENSNQNKIMLQKSNRLIESSDQNNIRVRRSKMIPEWKDKMIESSGGAT